MLIWKKKRDIQYHYFSLFFHNIEVDGNVLWSKADNIITKNDINEARLHFLDAFLTRSEINIKTTPLKSCSYLGLMTKDEWENG